MKAREMFEKLGYEQEKDDKIHITYYNDNFENKQRCDKQITFDLESKSFIAYSPYELSDYEDCSIFINIDELQAINKQVEEFGWSFTATPKEPTRKPDWELILYNKEGKVVLETNNYEDLIKFLGRRRETIYTFIYRAKRGLVRRVFDISGNAYTYDIKEF